MCLPAGLDRSDSEGKTAFAEAAQFADVVKKRKRARFVFGHNNDPTDFFFPSSSSRPDSRLSLLTTTTIDLSFPQQY